VKAVGFWARSLAKSMKCVLLMVFCVVVPCGVVR
jgi:hypothetical protein